MSQRPESFKTESIMGSVMASPLVIMYVAGTLPLPAYFYARLMFVLVPATAIIWLVCIVIGIKIAYGIGPSWMARTHYGVRILELIAYNSASGSQILNDLPPAESGYRYYLRVQLPDGVTEEYNTCRRTFVRLRRGQAGHIKTIGRRLLDFRAIQERSDLEIIDRT